MPRIFFTLLATALSLLVVDIIFPGVDLANFPVALAAAISIGLVNAVVKPILTILSFPLTLLSLGGFLLVLNGLCFWLAAVFVPGFQVSGLLAFFLAPVLLSVVNSYLNQYFANRLAPTTDVPQLED
ncbi:MAG: phage holin family protein [Acaryochloridaceae cyanobacterium SU_2_1]|nr:phage holin family protein [Acaryochloridaceae cyanobacterium SU_2_1]